MSGTSQALLLDEDYLILSTIHQVTDRGGQKEKGACDGGRA
jgi:hypothetical protein